MAKKPEFHTGAAILTVRRYHNEAAGLPSTKYLGNILGDEGYSMFTSASQYRFHLLHSGNSGSSVALSRLIAEEPTRTAAQSMRKKTFRVALATFAVIGVIFALILFLFPEWNTLEVP